MTKLIRAWYVKTLANLTAIEINHRNDKRWYGSDYKNTLTHDIINLKIEWLSFKLCILESFLK